MDSLSGSPSRSSLLISRENIAQTVEIDWNITEKTAKEIHGFLYSLDVKEMRGGLMLYNADKFCLETWSTWSDYYAFQWVATVGDKRTTFETVRGGFLTLLKKIEYIQKTILNFQINAENNRRGEKLQDLLLKIEMVIRSVSNFGLEKLTSNYSSNQFSVEAAALSKIGSDAFKLIETITKQLTEKLLPHIPELEANTKLAHYFYSARALLLPRNVFCENMQAVVCDRDTGLKIPVELVQDCLFEMECEKPNRETLQAAAAFVGLPKQAKEIPTQDGNAKWCPVRLIGLPNGGNILEEGVFGTCERNEKEGVDNLCNIYFKIEKEITIGCGAVNSDKKAEQLAVVMARTMELVPESSGRWVILSLTSFKKERKKTEAVHAHVPLNEEFFRKAIGRNDISLLHMNNCFNAATMFSDEIPTSLDEINIDSLAFFAQYLLTDIQQLLQGMLKETAAFNFLFGEDKSSFKSCSNDVVGIANEIIKAKKEIKKLKEDEIEGKDKKDLRVTVQESKSVKLANNASSEEKQFEFVLIEKPLRTVKECEECLSKKRLQLKDEFNRLNLSVLAAIEQLKAEISEQYSFEIDSALLSLEVYQRLLSVQLKLEGYKPLSRTREIELNLLLNRLLNANTIITCWSGLDRSGTIRALADSQSQLERELLQVLIEERKKLWNASPANEAIDRLKVRRQILQIIENFDDNRNELFSMTNQIIKDFDVKLVSDLKEFEQATCYIKDIRKELFARLDERIPSVKGVELMLTQRYSELYAKHLLGTEAVKPLRSNGAAGFKYLYDSGVKSFFANFHVIQSLPMFLFADDKLIQLLEYNKGFLNPDYTAGKNLPMKITKAGIQLTHRLSQRRGT